jgi:hypothetical protein
VAVPGCASCPHDAWWDTTGKGDPNSLTISIEHSKSSDNSSALSPAQFDATVKLHADICRRWGIPAQRANSAGGITGHYSMQPADRADCPGTFPWAEIIAAIGGVTTSGGNSGDRQLPGPAPVPPTGAPTVGPTSGSYTIPGAPASAGFYGAPIALSGANNAYLRVSDNAHQALRHTPGFIGIVSSIDDMEQYAGIYNPFSGMPGPLNAPNNAVMSVLGTAHDNAAPFFFRSFLVLVGFAIVMGLIIKAGQPLVAAGFDVMGKASSL